MSTKIYTGIKLEIDDIWSAEKQIREKLSATFDRKNEELTQQYFNKAYIESVYNTIKEHADTFPSLAEVASKAFMKYSQDKVDPSFRAPLDVKVAIYPPLDGSNTLLGFVSASDGGFYDDLLSLPFIEEYGYWNNADQPDVISDEEWDERRKNWDAIFDRSSSYGIFSTGVCIDLNRTLEIFKLDTRCPDTSLYTRTYSLDTLKDINYGVIRRIVADRIMESSEKPNDPIRMILDIVDHIYAKMKNVENFTDLPIFELPEASDEDVRSGLNLSLPRVDNELLEKWIEDAINATKEKD